MTTWSPAYDGDRPSFETDITLYQLCYWEVTRIYGIIPEEIKPLIEEPIEDTPSHHQVDPRIIKAYLTGEIVPTYLPARSLPPFFGILPAYLPRHRFLPSELEIPLVDDQYRLDYLEWRRWSDANKQANDFFTDHLTDPSLTINQGILEAPIGIPFLPTVRAAELRWWNGYFSTYHSFDDIILLRSRFLNSLPPGVRTISWYTNKSAKEIYTTALYILQVGLPNIQLHPEQPPNPDFNSISPEEKERIYEDLHSRFCRVSQGIVHRGRDNFYIHGALSHGDTGEALHSDISNQRLVIASLCRFQVILSHGYTNFPTIDNLRQILLDRYERIGTEEDFSRFPGPPPRFYRTVRTDKSWENGEHIRLPLIPLDSTIANNYRQYRDLAGIETDSVRNPPELLRQDSFTTDSLFDTESDLSEESEVNADHRTETIATDTVYSNAYSNNESKDE